MRGSKLKFKLAIIVLVLGICVAGFLPTLKTNKITQVGAENVSLYETPYCSQQYNDDIIFSVEQVYFADNRSTELFYDTTTSSTLTNILGADGENNYFANFGGTENYVSKKVIYNNQFVLLDKTNSMNAYTEEKDKVTLKQGVMVTLGGYIFNQNQVLTNSQKIDENNYYSSRLTNLHIDMFRNGEMINNEAGLRTYYQNATEFFDFVYFIEADGSKEGYYTFDISYTIQGGDKVSHTFSFYALLSDNYVNEIEVNGVEYSPYPNIANANSNGTSYHSTTYAEQYPVLTYDYKRYNMKFTYVVNDSTTNVSVEYDEDENQLKVLSETNGIKDKNPLSYQCQSSNSLVSFVFASMGSYSFEFNYVYYYDDERLVINNIDIPKMELNIYGYQLEYPKTDFASSNLRYLEIIKNSTTVIPYKGYTNNSITPDPSLELGYMYSFVEPVDSDPNLKISGNIKSSTTADLTNKIENSVTIDESKLSEKKISLTGLDEFEYINTDQTGLWLNLTDLYNLSESYYIYSPIRLKAGISYDAKTIEKTTKFKSAGYYFIKASYKVEDQSYFQYFAFRLSSATVSARLYKTNSESYPQISSVGDITDTQIYSNQFTNKNVYAYWEEPSVFESKQTVRLIYAKTGNVYRSKETLLNYLNGEPNANLTSEVYEKGKRIITENGSYLLSVSIDGTQIVSNSFFTIDKQDISGIEVLGVSSAVIGNTTVYNVARDSSNNPIKYTNKSLINKNFCLWWNNKSSGAEITAKYTFTPILSSGAGSNKITGTENEVNYVWLTTNYKLGKTSTELKIEKPLTQLATVNPEYVLTNQGIYWFTLEDSAGNSVNYMVVIDRTELIVSATSMGNEVLNGEMVAEDVSLEWGTHKAIDLESKELKDLGDNSIWSLMFNIFIKGEENSYYKASNSNLDAFKSVVKATSTSSSANLYLVVKNEYAKLTYSDHQLTINSNGATSSTSGSWANITNINSHSLIIGLKSNEERYVLYVYGENQIKEQGLSNSSFTVTLNPDKSEGSIKSTSGEDSSYNKVYSYNNSYTTESEFTKNFLNGQASDDNLFVFEWLSGEGSEYEVGEVYYDYYPLMTQSELNAYESGNANYAYYPYSSQSSRYYIYGGENNAQNYIVTSVDGKTICRSNVLNTGYVLDYDETGNLVSMDATLPGMYVVTREYASATNSEFDSQVRKYVFFVDRNNIVEYSTANISVKLVGEHIDILSQEKVVFSNYTQEVNTLSVGNNSYNIHLKSNRLPLQIRIPTGKYSSKVGDSIIHTSNSNSAGLKFNIYFVDTNNYLGLGANSFFKLFAMDNMMKNGSSFVTNGYIIYKLTSSSLYQGENNHSQEYLNACVQTGSDWLSLPGSYIIEIKDNVGKTIKENSTNVVEDCNVFLIGVEVEQSKPNINLYASQTTGNTGLTYANYSETKTSFDSSKAYVRYELPFEDTTSFKAQIDKDYIYITRTDGTKTEVYYSSITGGGIINKDTQFNDGENNISYIQMLSDKVVVWLDTGLTIENNKIIDYKEWKYEIKVRYILSNDDKYLNSYKYNIYNETGVLEKTVSYYENTFTANIDRLAVVENLVNSLSSISDQSAFFESYIKFMQDEEFKMQGKLDSKIYNTIAYRGSDGSDNYAVVNKLFYYYVELGEYEKAENSIYAIRVNPNDLVNTSNSTIYYRKLYKDSSAENRRMALLPVCSTYALNTDNKFETFSTSSYSNFNLAIASTSSNWRSILRDEGSFSNGYYEIIEVDVCGNYTQYVVYVADTLTQSDVNNTFNLGLSFADVSTSYNVKFNFVKADEDLNINVSSPSISLNNVETNNLSISLITFQSVEDMFGNISYANKASETSSMNSIDWFYKVNIIYGNVNKVYYLNINNNNLAEFLKQEFVKFENQNYRILITNRYNKTLSFMVSVLGQEYSLNLNGFRAKNSNASWFIVPKDLNSLISNSETGEVWYYASVIELKNLSKNIVETYTLNNLGEIIMSDGNNLTQITLETGDEYLATITDCAGKVYTKRLYAYENEGDSNISTLGNFTANSNVMFSSSNVMISFNNNIYENQIVAIRKDGVLIYSGYLKNNIIVAGTTYADLVINDKTTIVTFYPYLDVNSQTVAPSGALLEIQVDLIFNGETETNYQFVIDNRVNGINLINTEGEDKTNIVNIKQYYSTSEKPVVELKEENLFSITPSLTMSETVVLSWAGFDANKYSNGIVNYFNPRVLLYEFVTREEVMLENHTDNASKAITISPKEMSLGRYVLVIALYNQSEQLVMFKAFAFNVSSTANAMYEVQNVDGQVVKYNSSMFGREISNAMDEMLFNNMLTLFNLSPVNNGASLEELTKYNNYLKFMSQNLPVYITTEALKVVPNGDNGIQSLSYSFNISPEYKLEVFKVFSNVYATYLCILTVSETDELVNSADTSAIRFVSTGGEIKVSPLISTSSEFFDSFGSLYFTNFYKGSVTDDNTNALNIVKKNKLYLEVHYRYSASQIVKVGNFIGENLLNEDGTQSGVNYIEFSTSGTYLIYLKDLAGNTRIWNKGTANQSEYLMLTILPEAIVTVNNDIPVDYAYYNEAVHVSVAYVNSGYYDNGSVKMFAYLNGSTVDYITSIGGRKTNLINNFTFEDYGTYRVLVEAKRNGKDISKTLIFSIINPNEARLALDFTSISKYTITSVVNTTTQINVTNTFNFLINEGFIYSKLITYARLSAENAFGSTMGKQTFTVNYTVENDPLIPARQLSFSFTINNQTPSMQSSIKPGESTTKDITIKFNPQTIYRQVGDCYVTVNDVVVMAITSNNATDRIAELSLTEVGKYTVKIVSDSDRVLSSFQVTIKEPLNSWSILLIIGGILLVVGVVVTFILLRTKMKVR